ncbi:hypothetical protein [Muriicola sp. Z0-33]|uniref:hypothetical protein n=1 Tax=Muriicola sp. Z0-33 TaxID=2816957 RepID=UPI002238995D|nr:hypothetical protein [Muriicola sp. Z0-33]MCW5517787.1 hypothetical protein [Muriicola sp. Z0-33]
MSNIAKIGLFIFTAAFCCQGLLYAQEKDEKQRALTFFMEKALEDAIYEQNIQMQFAEDEVDFWKDQRNFERALKKKSYTAYQVYVNTKLEAYDSHRLECKTPQNHSLHYLKQGAFYSKHGKRVKITDNITAQHTKSH